MLMRDDFWESFVNDSRAVFPRQKVTESQSHQDVKYRMSYLFRVKVNFDPLDSERNFLVLAIWGQKRSCFKTTDF